MKVESREYEILKTAFKKEVASHDIKSGGEKTKHTMTLIFYKKFVCAPFPTVLAEVLNLAPRKTTKNRDRLMEIAMTIVAVVSTLSDH